MEQSNTNIYSEKLILNNSVTMNCTDTRCSNIIFCWPSFFFDTWLPLTREVYCDSCELICKEKSNSFIQWYSTSSTNIPELPDTAFNVLFYTLLTM